MGNINFTPTAIPTKPLKIDIGLTLKNTQSEQPPHSSTRIHYQPKHTRRYSHPSPATSHFTPTPKPRRSKSTYNYNECNNDETKYTPKLSFKNEDSNSISFCNEQTSINNNNNNHRLTLQLEKTLPKNMKKYADCISTANKFWLENIINTESNNIILYNQIVASFYHEIINKSIKIKQMTNGNLYKSSKIFFNMFHFMMKNIVNCNKDRFNKKLEKLGIYHKKLGVKRIHFTILINAFHETMSKHFSKNYSLRVRYCFDQLLNVCSSIMKKTVNYLQ